MRAHANCIQNLPVFAAIVLIRVREVHFPVIQRAGSRGADGDGHLNAIIREVGIHHRAELAAHVLPLPSDEVG
jgi:hypothetical protein